MKVFTLHSQKNPKIELRDLRHSFFLVDDVFLDEWVEILGAKVSMVYVMLCRMANKNQSCFPGIRYLEKKLRMGDKWVVRSLRLLEFYKLITIERKIGRQSIYWLNNRDKWKKPGEKHGLVKPEDFVELKG